MKLVAPKTDNFDEKGWKCQEGSAEPYPTWQQFFPPEEKYTINLDGSIKVVWINFKLTLIS